MKITKPTQNQPRINVPQKNTYNNSNHYKKNNRLLIKVEKRVQSSVKSFYTDPLTVCLIFSQGRKYITSFNQEVVPEGLGLFQCNNI